MFCPFFFNDPATTEIYTLSLHDALPIFPARDRAAPPDSRRRPLLRVRGDGGPPPKRLRRWGADRKSTRLNSSHANISYAVFCLKKKKTPVRSSVRPKGRRRYTNRVRAGL